MPFTVAVMARPSITRSSVRSRRIHGPHDVNPSIDLPTAQNPMAPYSGAVRSLKTLQPKMASWASAGPALRSGLPTTTASSDSICIGPVKTAGIWISAPSPLA